MTSASDKPHRILLVEDNGASAGDYIRWINAANHQIVHARSRSEAIAMAASEKPDVVLLDLQIPSEPDAADESTQNGFLALDSLLQQDPFRPVVIVTAHSRNRELMREVLQRTHGGQFVFKDDEDLARSLVESVAVALNQPAFLMSRTVKAFRALVARDEREDVYRIFIRDHWREILGSEYADCKSPYPITRGGEIDLLAIRHDGFPDLWELKRPSDPLFSPYNQWRHHSVECARALGQLMEYLDAAERESGTGLLNYEGRRGLSFSLQRPRGFVVIGRYSTEERERDAARERLRLENRFYAGVSILTYDDLIERAEQFLLFLQRYRNGRGTVG